jgi:hypothetical protein
LANVLLLPSTADEKKKLLKENLTKNVKITHQIEERWPNEPVIWGLRRVERGSLLPASRFRDLLAAQQSRKHRQRSGGGQPLT